MTKKMDKISNAGGEIWAESKMGNDVLQSLVHLFPAILYSYNISEDRFNVIGGSLIGYLGYALDDFKGKSSNTAPIVYHADHGLLKDNFLKCAGLKTGELQSCNVRLFNARGELLTFKVTILVSQRNSLGEAVNLLGIAQSEFSGENGETGSDRKELEMKIEKLARSNAELEEFTFIAAHDLQEPIRKLLTFGNSLKIGSQFQLDKTNADYLNRMLKAGENMKKLIEGLLEYSRISKRKESFVRIDLQDILRQTLIDQRSAIEEKKASVTFEKLPVLDAVPSQMKQLFGHLLENALKFSKTEMIPQIEINSAKVLKNEMENLNLNTTVTYWKIIIWDNGIGFEEKYAERIFLLLERLHGRTEYSGSGIGLAVCRRITDYHKGMISARSEPGNGSIFTIILPEQQNP